ncbi:hypothetical protein IDM40_00335 [Nocardiopsis sp. HNM0947]|uniref:Uncharacterized protein n=1 Tax=Nocardiopsis coralli TaxID=2772213 RepID=A0ABR9P003_9ACTN|nr:hypothetical protein [Nocardiopsis coralli]MBE2997153.1 hypothetical protein [Nocardiopsis coralli]
MNTPITVARSAFETLTTHHGPTVLEISALDGRRNIGLNWLAQRIPHLEQGLSDKVWQAVIERVRSEEPDWVTVGVGLASKPLWSVVNRVGRGRPFSERREELEAELVASWITQLHEVDTSSTNLLDHMWADAFKAGQRWRYRTGRDFYQLTGITSGAAHAPVGGSPEIALAEAVEATSMTSTDAELISATRIGGRSLRETARQLQLPYSTAKRRRRKAENTISELLTQETRS